MTTAKISRCIYCGDEYNYTTSGGDCLNELNDSQYCPGCKGVIVKALEENVPRKYEFRYVDIKDLGPEYQYITKEKIIEWNQQIEDKCKGKFRFQKCAFPLFDLNDPSNIEHSIIVTIPEGQFKGSEAEYRYWSKKSEWDGIRVKVEWDLINNKVVGG